jgi:chromate transporter
LTEQTNTENSPTKVTYWYLWWTFLKIGSTAFGGFIALVSVVQNQLAEKDKVIKSETILDGISLTSILPGPLAVNTVTFIGYQLRGIPGALICMAAVILPSFLLIYGISIAYFRYGNVPEVANLFNGILPAVCAIIVSIAVKMSRKTIKDYKQALLLVAAGAALILWSGFYVTVAIILGGGLIGYLLYRKDDMSTTTESHVKTTPPRTLIKFGIALGAIVLLIAIIPFLLPDSGFYVIKQTQLILATFGSMSVTLFGGGYVFIPTIQEVVVDNLHWLNGKEFADGIAMGQITPGPIMITSTFIGYKVLGFWGALVATIGMFLPTGILTIICSEFFVRIRNSRVITAAFKGIRPVVIGMILAAAYVIGKGLPLEWQTITIFSISMLLGILTKVNVIYLIIGAGIAGILVY